MNGTTTTNGDSANATQSTQPTSTQGNTQTTTTTTATTATAPSNTATAAASQEEDTNAYRPDSMRLMHLFLGSHNVQSYDERVPLMLLDFCHRYTTAVLQDAVLYSDASTTATSTGLTEDHLQMAVASRVNHQFSNKLPQAFNLEMAEQRNRVALPAVPKEFGVRLPPEKHCLTGISWNLDEEELLVSGPGGVGEDEEEGDRMEVDEERDESMVDA